MKDLNMSTVFSMCALMILFLSGCDKVQRLNYDIPTAAKPVKLAFSGTVTSVIDHGKSDLRRYFRVGDTFRGAYTFDSTTKDDDEDKGCGWYQKPYFNHPDSFIVIFDKDPENLTFKLDVPMHSRNQ